MGKLPYMTGRLKKTGCNLTGSSRFSEQDIQAQLPSRIARNAVAPVSNYPQSASQAQLAAESRPIELIERLQSGIRLAPLPYDMSPLKSQRSQLPGQRNRWPEGQPLRTLGSGIRRDRVSTLEGISKLGSLEAGSALLPSGMDANQIRQDPASQAQSKSAQPVSDATDGAAAQQVADVTAGDEDAESSTYEEGARPGRRLWQTLLLVRSPTLVGTCCRKSHVLTQTHTHSDPLTGTPSQPPPHMHTIASTPSHAQSRIHPLTCTASQCHSCCAALAFTVLLHLSLHVEDRIRII